MYRLFFITLLSIFASQLIGQDSVQGIYYLPTSQGLIKTEIKSSTLSQSGFHIIREKNISVNYPYKKEYKKDNFIYICYGDIPDSRLILKLSPTNDGDYNIYTVNFSDDINRYGSWKTSEIQNKIKEDTLHVRIGKLFSEQNFNKALKLKDNKLITNEDYLLCVTNSINEIKSIVDKIKIPNKEILEFWFETQPQLGTSILSEQLIQLGYKPFIDDSFISVLEDEEKYDLIISSGIDLDFLK